MLNAENEIKKWAPVIEHADAPAITDSYKKAVTAKLLENTEVALREEAQAATFSLNEDANTGVGSIEKPDPVLISLVRRAMPNLIAYDVAGVQPMSGPTGLIFAMKARFADGAVTTADVEAFGPETDSLTGEPDTDFSGTGAQSGGLFDSPEGGISTGTGFGTAVAEQKEAAADIAEMGFTIEKATVTAKSRALKAEYSLELAQDLKAIHGLDAETELANILSTEILAEINREVVRTINSQAKTGAATVNTAINGIFNVQTDADGRWSVEKFKGLILQLEREANTIAKQTRRGKGNFAVCSSDVASALASSGMLDYTPAMSTNLNVDDTGNTFAGVLNGRMRIYIDPYATTDYINVGYKGTNPYDAGVFYCPYVPLTMVRAVAENSFQPKIGFKTRYGMVSNPFVGATPANGLASAKTNQYYRIFRVDNILGT